MSEHNKKPYVIVLGNEKGGTGKSTISIHLIVNLLQDGYSVGSVDVDARQGTLTRYIENRRATNNSLEKPLPISDHIPLMRSTNSKKESADSEDLANLEGVFDRFANKDFIVVDTPGNDTALSRHAHSKADTLITPMNDSFIDLDVLVRLKGDSLDMLRPSHYAETVWNQKKQRAVRDGGNIDWIVLRNRLSSINAKNKEQMEQVMQALSKRLGFRYMPGFGERVIFKELFLSGRTLLDLDQTPQEMTLSHISARQELRNLLNMLNLPENRAVQQQSLAA